MPPPPPPPPVPKFPLNTPNQAKSNSSAPPPDRNALLSQIQKGTRLKKVETNDRSIPLVEANKSSSNSAPKRAIENKSNGGFPIIPPGGLFAQGIPKLRPVTPRSDASSQSSLVIQSIKSGSSVPSLNQLRTSGPLGTSRSQPPSPVSKPRTASNVSTHYSSETSESSGRIVSNPNFPDDITLKGPAPVPPPANQKPNFKPGNDSAVNKSMVKRSASQTNLGQRPRIARPHPSVRPPPPPKSIPAPPSTAPPPPPSKPPNIHRRQSFGVGEGHTPRIAAVNHQQIVLNDASASLQKSEMRGGAGLQPPPPPPPRNNSAPNDLNKIVSCPPMGNSFPKMNIAPPPPPNRDAGSMGRAAPMRPPPPRAPAPPPPPPQHQVSAHPAPPSQTKASLSANATPPPPPTRVSSIKQASGFEERFQFRSAQSFPKPPRYSNNQKNYPSKMNRQTGRRCPPPPPPENKNYAPDTNRPLLHIQVNPGFYSSNYPHS